MFEKITIEKTKKGLAADWESGGGCRNTGCATIIANPDGSAKTPVYIRKRGQLANQSHALFIVTAGDVVVKVDHHRLDYNITIYKIINFQKDGYFEYAVLEQVYCYSQGEWDSPPPEEYREAIAKAKEKAECYHCRAPHHFRQPGNIKGYVSCPNWRD